jgi:4-hydroxy-3-polyprenylbenzoate decarboxylase
VNTNLLSIDIPCLIVSVKKERKGHVKELHEKLVDLPELEGVKMILYVENTIDANDLSVALWRFCNNLDPKRDSFLFTKESTKQNGKQFHCLGLDGTIKTKDLDGFQRDWPNIIVADDATIESVDKKWNELGIGEFLASPSLKYKNQMYGEEAVASYEG